MILSPACAAVAASSWRRPDCCRIAACLLAALILIVFNNVAEAQRVRLSPLAGAWYPADPASLQTMLRNYLIQTQSPHPVGRLVALISPHAGYAYSGKAAAFGFRLLEEKKYDRVIIIGPSHYVQFHGIGVSSYDFYETPLGKVPVDRAVGNKLASHALFHPQDDAEAREHSLEMQIPYLQLTLKRFTIVPLIVGDLHEDDYDHAAEQLRSALTVTTLIIISSDFTHYGRRFGYLPFTDSIKENLERLDRGAAQYIMKKDLTGYEKYLQTTGITMCGSKPIRILLRLLPPQATGELLNYYTSGDLTKEYSSAVSYASIVFHHSE